MHLLLVDLLTVVYTSLQLESIEESPFGFLVPAAAKSHLRAIRQFLAPMQDKENKPASESSSSSSSSKKAKADAKSD